MRVYWLENNTAGKRIVLISSKLHESNKRLQPWRYLIEVALGLAQDGHSVTLISDGARLPDPGEHLCGLPLFRLPGLRPRAGQGYSSLRDALAAIRPQVILWNAGLTSLLYQDFHLYPPAANIAIFTSPLYTLPELARLGPGDLFRYRSLAAVHLLGSLLPRRLLRSRLRRSGLRLLVTQTGATRDQLRQARLWPGPIEVIPPAVDKAWRPLPPAERLLARQELGFTPADCVVVYFGSPAPLRGLPDLVQAVELARRENPFLKLLVLSRRRPGELRSEDRSLSRFTSSNPAFIRLVDGLLDPPALVRFVAAADLAALPFRLVPSDAPLSLLEARSLGLPVVTTRVACLPELAAPGPHYLADPAAPASLARALLQAAANPPLPAPARRDWREVQQAWSGLLQAI
jgi:glycosyltransferase involved in cell wall biosynthesis